MAAPFLPIGAPVLGERELRYVTEAIQSGWVSSKGAYVDRFERAFAEVIGVPHAVSVVNGTAALHLALHAIGIGPGDEVIVPDLTFAATAHAALMVGATPVFVDIDPVTWCLDPVALERAIGPRTRAILPVHLYGYPCDMAAVLAIAARHGIHVVEDAAEALGSSCDGRALGSFGRAACFSFFANKTITTGEGGMVTTADAALADRLRFLRGHGLNPARHYFHTELAFNYRMTNLQAALGLAQLERLPEFVGERRRIGATYRAALGHRKDLLTSPQHAEAIDWMFSVVLPPGRNRDAVAAALLAGGIESRPFFVAMSQLPHLAHFRAVNRDGDGCPVAARLCASGLNLPTGGGIDDASVHRVCRTLEDALGE